jgi:FkbM family methyltransferase
MEIRCSKLLQRLPSIEGGVVLDVGGSYGYYALLLSRSVGGKGRVYTFEPDWHSFERLTRNLAVNHVENVVPVPVCAWNASVALAPWLSCEEEPWKSRLMGGGIENKSGRQTVVPAVPLDAFAEALHMLGDIRLIKIDVEGAEWQVLRGARRILEESGPLVLCELHGTEVAKQVLAYLLGMGFEQQMIEYMSETRQQILAYPRSEADRTRRAILNALG